MHSVNQLIVDLLTVLAAGFLSGMICKRTGISLLVGYMLVGAIIGQGGLGFVSQENHELEYLARAGALLLLFSVGIEFSLDELLRLSRYFFVGGVVQMILVTVPLTCVCLAINMPWQTAVLLGAAGALSSTVLVFKALNEWGQTATQHGRRAIGILLFQDVALVPLMLVVPLLTGTDDQPTFAAFGLLVGKSLVFVAGILVLRRLIRQWMVPLLADFRSVELVVLFTLTLLGGVCWLSSALGLPPALGALATGLVLSGNRLSRQIDTLILPYRESFAAVFFVTLGTLLQPLAFIEEPLLLTAGLVAVLALKSVAAATALKLIGLNWKAAAGMGIGLAQLGEFSFVLIAEGSRQGIINFADYNRMLFIALGSLILTPQLLKFGLRWTDSAVVPSRLEEIQRIREARPINRAIVVGIGLAGRRIASRLETHGVEACLIDLSPINLHAFAQEGFPTITGDARDPDVLHRADVARCSLAVVCVPRDEVAMQIVRSLRELNASLRIVVRCRFQNDVAAVRNAGADLVVSEEQEAANALAHLCDQVSVTIDPDAPPSTRIHEQAHEDT